MDLLAILNGAVVLIGVPLIVKVLLDIGGKLKTLNDIEADIRENIRPDLKDVREKFFALEGRASSYFASASPIKLLPAGERILVESGIKGFIDTSKDSLLHECTATSLLTNPYDVQKAVFKMFDEYDFPKDTRETLKSYAYDHGITMDIIRRIGAIYFRDICLAKLDMKEEDIDKHDPDAK